MPRPSSLTQPQKALALAKRQGLLRTREARAAGVATETLSRLVAAGKLRRVARGLYRSPEVPEDEHATLAEAAKLVPAGVVVLLSALAFHGIGTQQPAALWLMLPHKANPPRQGPPIEVVRSRLGAAFSAGVETHHLGIAGKGRGVAVRVTNPARTVADCFKYRRQVGMEVCLEALREVLRERRAEVGELLRFARMNRVEGTLRPALEAML